MDLEHGRFAQLNDLHYRYAQTNTQAWCNSSVQIISENIMQQAITAECFAHIVA